MRSDFSLIEDHVRLAHLNVLLDAVVEIAYPTVSEAHEGQPAPGSVMADDMDALGPDAVGAVQRVCGAWNMVASEALQGVAAVHRSGLLLTAPGPLLRSTLEHAVGIGWVLDGPEASHRAARAWLVDVVATGEDVHTHRNAGNPSPTLAEAPARLEELCETTLPRLFDGARPDRTRSKRPSDWTFLEQSWGAHTTRSEEFFQNHVKRHWGQGLDGRVQYRVDSMFAHPSTSAVFAFADRSEDSTTTFSWDWEFTRRRTGAGLIAFYSATRSLYAYLGWNPPALGAWAEHLRRFVTETGEPDEPSGPIETSA